MATLKREWMPVADLPGAPFRGAFGTKSYSRRPPANGTGILGGAY